MSQDLSKLVATSAFSGFKNTATADFSTSVPLQSLLVNTFVSYTTTTNLNNTNAISQIQIQYTNLETFYREVPGNTILRYPTYTTPNFEVGSQVYFSNGILNVFTYIANQTAGTVSVPAFTITCRAFLFVAPFTIS